MAMGSSISTFVEPRVTVPITMPRALLERVNALAMQRRMNRSELIRDAIVGTYFGEQPATGDNSEPEGGVTHPDEKCGQDVQYVTPPDHRV